MLRGTLLSLVAAVALIGAVGCDDDPETPAAAVAPPVAVEVSDTGYAMPERIAGGAVTMRFTNVGSQPHELALGLVEGERSADEILQGVRDAHRLGRPPAWLSDVAGPPLLSAGATITIARTLAPGTYVFFDSFPDRAGAPGLENGLVRAFTVEGDSGATLPAPDAVIVAGADGFEVPPLTAGPRTIELRNASGGGREFRLATLSPGSTEEDVARWGESLGRTGRLPAGPVPATFLGAMQTIPDAASVFLTLDLESGREYVLSDDGSGAMERFTPR